MRLTRFRPRLTLRWLMVLVAILALCLGGEVTRRRWASLSKYYQAKAEVARFAQGWYQGLAENPREKAGGQGQVDFLNEVANHLGRMAEKYERAARYPWLPVEPDPPETSLTPLVPEPIE